MLLVCYSREDERILARLWRMLSALPLQLVRDVPTVQGDAFWRRALADQLAEANALLVIWSAQSAASPWVDEEICAFRGPVVAVELDKTPLSPTLVAAGPHRCRPFELAETLSTLDLPGGVDTEGWTGDGGLDAARSQLTDRIGHDLERLIERGLRQTSLVDSAAGGGARNSRDGLALERIEVGAWTGYLSSTPVTNACYRRFIDEVGWEPPPPMTTAGFDHPDQPVVGVTWFEAQAYAAWVGGRLPTVDEWRAAAELSLSGHGFATSTGALTADTAWFGQPIGDGTTTTAEHFPPSPAGFFGLSGNTWDWCLDPVGSHRAIVGGGYADTARFCTARTCYRAHPVDRDSAVGFRVAIPSSVSAPERIGPKQRPGYSPGPDRSSSATQPAGRSRR